MFQCCITEGASAGFGQAVAPGGCILNFAACYTCHGREKIRRCRQHSCLLCQRASMHLLLLSHVADCSPSQCAPKPRGGAAHSGQQLQQPRCVWVRSAGKPWDYAVRTEGRRNVPRKYNLPAVFGLPPGFDDCCTHFICMYCASHQEARELVVRGVDGPGKVTSCWHWLLGHIELSSLLRCRACAESPHIRRRPAGCCMH